MLEFMKVKNSTDGLRKELYLYGDIVDDSWNYGWEDDPSVYPLNIKDMLKDFGGSPVDVHINSGGGHMFAGMAIANMLKAYQGETVCYVDGVAASAASLIAFGCDRIIVPDNAFLMIHKPMCNAFGNADDLEKAVQWLNQLQEVAVNLYKTKALEGITDEQISEMINAETWLSGIEAKKYFNVEGSSNAALNCQSEQFGRYLKTPQNIQKTKKDDDLKLKQEVELALAIFYAEKER